MIYALLLIEANQVRRKARKDVFERDMTALLAWIEKSGQLLAVLHPKTGEHLKKGGTLILGVIQTFNNYIDALTNRIRYLETVHQDYLESYKMLLSEDVEKALLDKLHELQFQNDLMTMELWTKKSINVEWHENKNQPHYIYDGKSTLRNKETGEQVTV